MKELAALKAESKTRFILFSLIEEENERFILLNQLLILRITWATYGPYMTWWMKEPSTSFTLEQGNID